MAMILLLGTLVFVRSHIRETSNRGSFEKLARKEDLSHSSLRKLGPKTIIIRVSWLCPNLLPHLLNIP